MILDDHFYILYTVKFLILFFVLHKSFVIKLTLNVLIFGAGPTLLFFHPT